jgi:hypothetical protein
LNFLIAIVNNLSRLKRWKGAASNGCNVPKNAIRRHVVVNVSSNRFRERDKRSVTTAAVAFET